MSQYEFRQVGPPTLIGGQSSETGAQAIYAPAGLL